MCYFCLQWDEDDEYPCTQYFNNANKYSYEYLELATEYAFLTTLYVSFVPDILSLPNKELPGLVSPAKVETFGFSISKIATNTASETSDNTISIRLYWDIDLYICQTFINNQSQSNHIYICNVTDSNVVQTNSDGNYEIDNENVFIWYFEGNDNIEIDIDYLFVTDESGYNYYIEHFCSNENDTFISSKSSTGNICDDFDDEVLHEFEEIILNDEILAIEFAKDLFKTARFPNDKSDKDFSHHEGFIYTVSSFDDIIVTSSTTTSTTENTISTETSSISTISTVEQEDSTSIKSNNYNNKYMTYIWILIAIVIVLFAILGGICLYQKRKIAKLKANFVLINGENNET